MALRPLLRLELLRQRRQPMVLLSLGLMGLFGTPFGASQALEQGSDLDLESDLIGDQLRSVPRIEADATFASWVTSEDELELAEGPLDVDGDRTDDEVVAKVSVDPDARVVRVETGPASPRVSTAIQAIRKVRSRHDREARDVEAERLGVDLAALQPTIEVETHERANTKVSPWVLYGLPWLLTMLATTGTLYGAFDVLLSERLHHTAETLLTSAATRRSIAMAKALVVAGLGMTFAALSLLGLTVAHLAGLFPTLDPAPGPWLLVGSLFASMVLSTLLASVFLGIATFCEDHKTAGLVAGPMLMAPPILATIAAFPGPPLNLWSAFLPVTNVLLVWRDALLGTLTLGGALGVGAVVALQIGLAWRFTARRLADPDIVTGVATAEGRRGMGRFGLDALTTYALGLACFWFIGVILQQLNLEAGLVVTQLCFAALGLGAASYFGMPRERLRLALPHLPAALLGVALGLCTPALAGTLMWAQEFLLPGGEFFAEAFGDSMGLDRPLWLSLVLFALLPGLCEELLFRSSLLGMLERDARPWARVVLVALLFGLLHLSIYRLLPTMALGVVLGWVTLRSRSVWPAVALHVTHNGCLIAASSLLEAEPDPTFVGAWITASTVGFLGATTALRRLSPDAPPRSAPAEGSAGR